MDKQVNWNVLSSLGLKCQFSDDGTHWQGFESQLVSVREDQANPFRPCTLGRYKFCRLSEMQLVSFDDYHVKLSIILGDAGIDAEVYQVIGDIVAVIVKGPSDGFTYHVEGA